MTRGEESRSTLILLFFFDDVDLSNVSVLLLLFRALDHFLLRARFLCQFVSHRGSSFILCSLFLFPIVFSVDSSSEDISPALDDAKF